ncbi:MAG: insulinase family protein [Bacteroidales bacterium]|nr:MAG: insulinase family protein [Bacteroidales bacterium]
MINFEKIILGNGLKVIVHTDKSTPLAALNILYNVGARDEHPDKTGFAHLFEHLMFEGSVNIPDYDGPLQKAGGENNAFTNNDITNYYLTLPRENTEIGFWLESDRMLGLDFSEQKLNVQKQVVAEEYRQRYLNQPYGDVWLLLRPLAYKVHPYQWPTIGRDISHIDQANLNDVKNFFFSQYAPNNAILVVAGNIEIPEVEKLARRWFSPIRERDIPRRTLPPEPKQRSERKQEVERNVPFDAIYKVFHMCGRNDPDFHTVDVISDILSNGKSSRLYQNLVQSKRLFSEVDAYLTGEIDPGLFILSGKIIQGVKMEDAEQELMAELHKIKTVPVRKRELDKIKNKVESRLVFEETNVLNKAMNLAFHELLGDANEINNEIEKYHAVTPGKIRKIAAGLLVPSNCSTLYYRARTG